MNTPPMKKKPLPSKIDANTVDDPVAEIKLDPPKVYSVRTVAEILLDPEVLTPPERIKTGIAVLDKLLCGGLAPTLYVLTGGTGGGKSTLARNIAYSCARAGTPTLLLTLEDRAHATIRWLLARVSSVPVSTIENRQKYPLSAEHEQRLQQAKEDLSKLPLFVDECTSDLTDTEDMIRQYVQLGIRGALIDQSSWLGTKHTTPLEKYSEIARRTSTLARDLKIPILLLHQPNRNGSQAEKLELHHLRDSGRMEQDAGAVLAIQPSLVPGEMLVEILKNREGGGVGNECHLKWTKCIGRVVSDKKKTELTKRQKNVGGRPKKITDQQVADLLKDGPLPTDELVAKIKSKSGYKKSSDARTALKSAIKHSYVREQNGQCEPIHVPDWSGVKKHA